MWGIEMADGQHDNKIRKVAMFDNKTKEYIKSKLGLVLIRLSSGQTYDINDDLDKLIAWIEKEVNNLRVQNNGGR